MELLTQPGDTHTTAAAPNPPNRHPSRPEVISSGMVKRSLAMNVPETYDALGRRIMKEDSLNAANTRYYYYNDIWQIVTEYDLPTSAGVYKQLYAYGNYIDEVVYAYCPGATYTMRRYLHDHLYSPAAIVYLTASNCILVERSEYDAYGAAHYYNADYSQTFAVSQHGNPFAFTGREIDSFDFASGLPQLTKMHYRHRDYSPFMGRFYQQDPAQYIGGLNLYEYVKSRPVIYVDNLGLFSIDVIGTPTFKRNHCLNGKPDGTGCVSYFWMSLALRPTPEEVEKIASYKADGGFAVLRKYARWRQVDCESNLVIEDQKEAITLVKRLYTTDKGKIVNTGPAGKGGTLIVEMPVGLDEDEYVSPYYSGLIAKELKEPVSTCCSKGKITVIAEFFLYAGKINLFDGKEFGSNKISQPEYDHAFWGTNERIENPDSLIGDKGERISRGTLQVDIEWDCNNNVTAKMNPRLPIIGNLTRSTREGDWWKANYDMEDNILFPIKFN